jgi:hypothetical protein
MWEGRNGPGKIELPVERARSMRGIFERRMDVHLILYGPRETAQLSIRDFTPAFVGV